MMSDAVQIKTHRLFVALELPDTVRSLLASQQKFLSGVRWTALENLHLTLYFIGEVSSAQVPGIKSGLRTVQARGFSLQVKGLGFFDKRPQAVVWAGIVPSPALPALQRQVRDVLALHVSSGRNAGRFSPHITLGRTKQTDRAALKSFIAKYSDATVITFKVESFTLFRSVLTPGGAVHSVEERYPLSGELSAEIDDHRG